MSSIKHKAQLKKCQIASLEIFFLFVREKNVFKFNQTIKKQF